MNAAFRRREQYRMLFFISIRMFEIVGALLLAAVLYLFTAFMFSL